MTAIRLGLRYERLLIFAAPLTLVALLVLFVAFASVTQKERASAHCFEAAVGVLTKSKSKLDEEWDKVRLNEWKGDYELALKLALIDGGLIHVPGIGCYSIAADKISNIPASSPADIISKFQVEANTLNNSPLEYHDVEIPQKATLNLLGTDVKIGLMTFVRFIQIALAPLLLLWLGSLYATRFRESHMVGSASSLSEVFPHSINIYATGRLPQLRKRNFILYHWPKVVTFMAASCRMASLAVFIVPPVIFYIASLFYLHIHNEEYFPIFLFLTFSVASACLVNLALEFCPWHFWKIFTSSGFTDTLRRHQ